MKEMFASPFDFLNVYASLLATSLFFLSVQSAFTQPYSLFSIDLASDKVVTIDLTTGAITDFASLPFDATGAGQIGMDYRKADGKLYISRATSEGLRFYSVDPTSSAVLLSDKVVPSITDYASIGFTDLGDLYVYYERSAFLTGDLVYIDWATMSVTPRSSGSRSPSVLGGDYDQIRDVYWSSDEWDGNIYQLNAQTGERVWTSSSSWFGGLTGDMLDMDVTPNGEVLVIAQGPYGEPSYSKELLLVDPNNGTWSTKLVLDPNRAIDVIATVPEPSTYALLLLSGAASLWALKRRKS